MNHTSRMTALLGEIRRERNGAVADSMRLVGRPCGLNYGVSLPTLRRLARAETPDHDFAEFLSVRMSASCVSPPSILPSPTGSRPTIPHSGLRGSTTTNWPRRRPLRC